MQAVVSGRWAVQWSWHVTKAQGGLLLKDCRAAYLAVKHFPMFLWSKVKHSAAPECFSRRAKYCGISGHVSKV